jgi:hypothetical protein
MPEIVSEECSQIPSATVSSGSCRRSKMQKCKKEVCNRREVNAINLNKENEPLTCK